MNVAVIGAGAIAEYHIIGYKKNPDCNVKAIADVNISLAQERANTYEIPDVYSDYKELLKDDKIDAVSVATPTFTHKDIVIAALKSGKHVLCEKPPAMNADDVRECEAAAKENGKLLMFGFCTRFRNQIRYLKKYIDDGKMGKILSAECGRVARCTASGGWYSRREKGGGFLMDAAIHELDNALYLMGYPKPVAVLAGQTFANGDLYEKLNSAKSGWTSKDTSNYKRNIESAISGYVTFDNGATLFVKAASVLNSIKTGAWVDVSGEKAGARLEPELKDSLRLLELTESNCFVEPQLAIENSDFFIECVNHFVDCCIRDEECICKVSEAIALMEIINAIYKSADTGKPVIF